MPNQEITDGDVFVTGNAGDYTLTRLQARGYEYHYSGSHNEGDFYLTAKDGGTSYLLSEAVRTVHFANGQYLALQDLSAYVAGNPTLATGTGQNDLLYQGRIHGFEAFKGGGGSDTLFLNGSARDYTIRSFELGYGSPGAPTYGSSYNHIAGLELVATNGSGRLLIDASIETIVFKDGSQTAYTDLTSTVTAGSETMLDHLAISWNINGLPTFGGAPGSQPFPGSYEPTEYRGDAATKALLNGTVSDYTLSRYGGEFLLSSNSGDHGQDARIEQSIGSVLFADGRYLAPIDLDAYVAGSGVLTQGTDRDDLLLASFSGDQYLIGSFGSDIAYIHGNVRDYTLRTVDQPASANTPAIKGYELVANNGSGDLYIDRTTEVVHFQNGQYLAFTDLPAYIHDPMGLV